MGQTQLFSCESNSSCLRLWPFVTAEGVRLPGAVALNTGIPRCIDRQSGEEERRAVHDVEQHLQLCVPAALGCPLDRL